MTPRKRAEQLQKEFDESGNQSTFDFVTRFEEAIAVAIEEEREACAKIADYYVAKKVQSFQFLSVTIRSIRVISVLLTRPCNAN